MRIAMRVCICERERERRDTLFVCCTKRLMDIEWKRGRGAEKGKWVRFELLLLLDRVMTQSLLTPPNPNPNPNHRRRE